MTSGTRQDAIEQARQRENFPVASLLMPRKVAKQVKALYRFARGADDIADHPELAAEEREKSLQRLLAAYQDKRYSDMPEWASPFAQVVTTGGCLQRHGEDLLAAFIQDTQKTRYRTYEELWEYCMHSAAPIGRAVLEMHQEWYADFDGADHLCNALQLLNHLQDLKSDYTQRDRIYLPQCWHDDPEALQEKRCSASLRQAIDQLLEHTDRAIDRAYPFLRTISGFRLRAEIATIYFIARRLSQLLRKQDPLAERVALSRSQYIHCFFQGLAFAFKTLRSSPSHRRRNLKRWSQSSFFWPLFSLPGEKRRAMFALYGFCQRSDSTIDEAEDLEAAQHQLAFWQQELDGLFHRETAYPRAPASRRLIPYLTAYHLEEDVFRDLLAGYHTDSRGILRPSLAELERYCYQVASAVGLLSIRIFGYSHPDTERFARHLGQALQRINILRDIQEDAANERIYLPQEYLTGSGIGDITPERIMRPTDRELAALQDVARKLASDVTHHFEQALRHLPAEDRRSMRPALAMMRIYHRYFETLQKRGFIAASQAAKPSLPWWYKLWLCRPARVG